MRYPTTCCHLTQFSPRTVRETRKKVVKRNRSCACFTLILLAHILVYLFKNDRDVLSVQEYGRYPYQTYTEQLLSENAACFGIDKSDSPRSCKSSATTKHSIDRSSIWRSILLSFDSQVHHLLKHRQPSSVAATRAVLVFQKQNICHKSSEDEGPVCRFLKKSDQTKFNG